MWKAFQPDSNLVFGLMSLSPTELAVGSMRAGLV